MLQRDKASDFVHRTGRWIFPVNTKENHDIQQGRRQLLMSAPVLTQSETILRLCWGSPVRPRPVQLQHIDARTLIQPRIVHSRLVLKRLVFLLVAELPVRVTAGIGAEWLHLDTYEWQKHQCEELKKCLHANNKHPRGTNSTATKEVPFTYDCRQFTMKSFFLFQDKLIKSATFAEKWNKPKTKRNKNPTSEHGRWKPYHSLHQSLKLQQKQNSHSTSITSSSLCNLLFTGKITEWTRRTWKPLAGRFVSVRFFVDFFFF